MRREAERCLLFESENKKSPEKPDSSVFGKSYHLTGKFCERFFGRCPQNDTLRGMWVIMSFIHTPLFLQVILSEAKNLRAKRLNYRKGSA